MLEQPTEASHKTWLTLALFALVSAAAAATPSPWWEGTLLDIEPVLPWAAPEQPLEAAAEELLAAAPTEAPPQAEPLFEASGSADAPNGSAEMNGAEAGSGSGSGASSIPASEGSAGAAPPAVAPPAVASNDPVISDAPPTADELRQVRPAIAALVA